VQNEQLTIGNKQLAIVPINFKFVIFLQIVHCQLPIAYCILPIAHCPPREIPIFFYKTVRVKFSLFIFAVIKTGNVKKSRGIYWILFFISIIAFFAVYRIGGGYCSLVLPFNCTFFAQAMDLM